MKSLKKKKNTSRPFCLSPADFHPLLLAPLIIKDLPEMLLLSGGKQLVKLQIVYKNQIPKPHWLEIIFITPASQPRIQITFSETRRYYPYPRELVWRK